VVDRTLTVRPSTTEARCRGPRSSEDQAFIGEGTFVEGLSLWLPSLSDEPCIGARRAGL
jgi:hypothetical protein